VTGASLRVAPRRPSLPHCAAGNIKINGVTLTPTTPLSALKGSLVAVQGNGAVKVGP